MSNGRIKVRPYEYDRLALQVAKYRRDDLKRMVNLVAVHVKSGRPVRKKSVRHLGSVSTELAECMRNEWFRIRNEMGDEALDVSNADRIIELLEKFKREKYDPLVAKMKMMKPYDDEEDETLKDRIKILEIQNERYRKMAEKFKREKDVIQALYQERINGR